MRDRGLLIIICVIACVLIWLTVANGWWWMTLLIGLLTGLFVSNGCMALLIAFFAGAFGWGLPLAVLAFKAPVGQIARSVEGVIGLSNTGGLSIVILTVFLGCMLSVTGSWTGSALRQAISVMLSRKTVPKDGGIRTS